MPSVRHQTPIGPFALHFWDPPDDDRVATIIAMLLDRSTPAERSRLNSMSAAEQRDFATHCRFELFRPNVTATDLLRRFENEPRPAASGRQAEEKSA